jgi:death on curing protein
MRHLTVAEVLDLHHLILQGSGGMEGVRDMNALESALGLPRMTFEGAELYTTIADKASALAFSLIKNHPFLDGNKRVGHAAMETYLVLNGHEIGAPIDEQEQIILQLAEGSIGREEFTDWLRSHLIDKDQS